MGPCKAIVMGTFKVCQLLDVKEGRPHCYANKTSILWTPGSQVYLSKKKKRFGQRKQIRKMQKSCIIND